MERVPEPELMLTRQQAEEYAAADFEEPHGRFLELLRERLPDLRAEGVALDLGAGPGDIAMRFATAFPDWRVDAVDGSPAMLACGREAAERRGLGERVRFVEACLPDGEPPGSAYDLVFSNSLLHHLRDPDVLWQCARQWAAPGASFFAMDLLRPASPRVAAALVELYSGDEPEGLKRDFYCSLLAAYRPDEVREQLKAARLSHLRVEVVSDRHLIVWGRVEG